MTKHDLTNVSPDPHDCFSHAGCKGIPCIQSLRCSEIKMKKEGFVVEFAFLSLLAAAAIKGPVADYPWAGFRRVVDVGGAHGSALAAILEAHPKPDGLLFDQPQVLFRPPHLRPC